MSNKTTTLYNIIEDNMNPNGESSEKQVETDIQVAYLNLLYEQGFLADNVHSIALNKIIKGVI